MIPDLRKILSEAVDIKPLDDLLRVKEPNKEPDHGDESVQLRGLLMARNSAYIGVLVGDMLIKVAAHAVKSAKLDPSPPAQAAKSGKYVLLEVVKGSELLVFRKMDSSFLGDSNGHLPFVLSTPSEAKDYAAAADIVDAKNKKREEALNAKWTPIPFTPIEPLFDPNKSMIKPLWDDPIPHNVNSPYDTKVSKAFNTPIDSAQQGPNGAYKITDYNMDDSVDTTTDANSDVKLAKVGTFFTVNTAYDTKVATSGNTPYETLQHNSANGQTHKVTDHNLDFHTEVSTDGNSDVEDPSKYEEGAKSEA